MNPVSLIIAAAALALAGCASFPGGARVTPDSGNQATAGPATGAAPVEPQMQQVQEMHRQMMASTTPEERTAMMNKQKQAAAGDMPMTGQMKAPMTMPAPTGSAAMAAGQMPGADTKVSDAQIQKMQQLHLRMQSAKTPKERAERRQEFMKAAQGNASMKSSMAMPMQDMHGAPAGSTLLAEHNALMRRVAMLETMMQMMVKDDGEHGRKPGSRKRR